MTTGSSPADGAMPPAEELLLPRPPGVVRKFWARHPWVTDSTIAGVYLAIAVFSAVLEALAPDNSATASTVALHIGASAIAAVAILFRRRRSLLALWVACGYFLLLDPASGQSDIVPVLFLLYAVAVYRTSRAAWLGLAVAVPVAFLRSWFGGSGLFGSDPVPASATFDWIGTGVQLSVLMLTAVVIGINIGNRMRYMSALLERAAQLARERDQQAEIASAAERARIAREMHDVVAHSLSVVVSLADGAAATVDANPARARDAMESVAETGRRALGEMRRLLGVLHEPDGEAVPLAPQPTLGELDELLATYRNAGLPVTTEITGTAPADQGLQLAVFRIAQESLTNALRYSVRPTRVHLVVTFGPTATTVELSDNGTGTVAPTGSGRGLMGMRQRASLFGGTVTAGPAPTGGWRVSAVLPRTETPA